MKILILILLGFSLTGCLKPSSDDIQNMKQEELNSRAVTSVGLPSIVNFQEKRLLKDIFELRDQALPTYTYTVAEMTGKRIFLCNSIGYGIPAATQFTNPQKAEYTKHGPAVLPQADPNGLYSPSSAEGTWVLCLNPETKKASPLYVEPRIIVSQFKLE